MLDNRYIRYYLSPLKLILEKQTVMSKHLKFHRVTFLPENRTIKVEHLKTVFETILENNPRNIQLNFACGAEGICRKCKIRSFKKMGPYTPTEKGCLSGEEIDKGVRLACQARVIQDMKAEIIFKMPFSIMLMDEPICEEVDLKPGVEKHHFTSDADLEKGDTTDKNFAVAVDLGVNTLVASLIDRNKGRKIAVVSDTNPQIDMGTDIESRIDEAARDPANLEILNEEILLRIDILVCELCRVKDISPLHVHEIVIAGATGLLDFLINGVPGLSEHKDSFDKKRKMVFPSEQAEIRSSPGARIHAFPVISSFVGADTAAGILATGLHRSEETVLFLDLGYVATAVLFHEGKIAATGISGTGAFECAGTGFGMRPVAGAVESLTFGSDMDMSVIGESLPRGICGSGLMELTAELKRIGVINQSGDFQDPSSLKDMNPEIVRRVSSKEGKRIFLLYSDEGDFQTDIYVSQEDIFLLRQAKASVLAMINSLLRQMGVTGNKIKRVLVGGAFGYRVRTEVFFELGLIPLFLKGNVSFAGNTSVKGAQMALMNNDILEEAEKMVQDVICIPFEKPGNSVDDLHFLPWV